MITIVQVIQAALKVVNTCNHNGNITDVKLYAWNMYKYNTKKKKRKKKNSIYTNATNYDDDNSY